jgi:hypothetical protein
MTDASMMSVNPGDAIKAMDLRQQVMVFPKAKFIQNGYERIDDHVDLMRNAVCNKDGIVPAKDKGNFNYFVQNCMTRTMI